VPRLFRSQHVILQVAGKSSRGPVRSCLGCSARRAKRELVRFVNKDGTLVPDLLSLAIGRGAYLCYDKECFLRAFKKNVFARALKIKVRQAVVAGLRVEGKPLLEVACERLWQDVTEELLKTEKIKEVRLKG